MSKSAKSGTSMKSNMSMNNLNLSMENKNVSNFFKNDYVSWGLKILLVLYAAMVAPQLNREVSMIFDNIIVRLIIAVLIVFLSFYDVTLAILLAICFVVSIQTLNKHKITSITTLPENFASKGMEEEDEDEDDEMMENETMENFNNHDDSMVKSNNNDAEGDNMMEINNENMESFKNMSESDNMMIEQNETNDMMEQNETNDIMMDQNESFMGGATPNDSFMRVDGVDPKMMNNQNLSNDVSICGGPNNQFTNQRQLYDAGNNYVNKNQNNSIATFYPELNPQGSNSPLGTNMNSSLQNRASNF